MALTSRTEGHVLPCGRRLEDLWDRMATRTGVPPDDHERACEHCRAARSSLQALAEATRAVYEDESLVPTAGLRNRIMDAVRAEVRRGDRLPLPSGELGPVDVSEQAVAVVLRFAADTVEGVRARRCKVHPLDEGGPAGGSPARVEMSISMRYSRSTSWDLVEDVRARVVAAADAHVGLDVTRIDIEIEDVYRDHDDDDDDH